MVGTISYFYGRPWDFQKEKVTFSWDGSAVGVNLSRGGKMFFVPCMDRKKRGLEIEKGAVSVNDGPAGLMEYVLHSKSNISIIAINAIIEKFS